MSTPFNLERYLQRMDYRGPSAPTLQTLHALTAAQVRAIPFENIDVLLGRPIALNTAALYSKMVLKRRGGYCFELNGLLLIALQHLGFRARPLGARMRLQHPQRNEPVARTHMLLLVELGGQPWITDVGVGSTSLGCALRLVPELTQPTPYEPRRLQRDGTRWYHQVLRDGQWVDVYEFTLDDYPLVDREVANWYSSTHPGVHFTQHLLVARALPGGARATLSNRRFTLRTTGDVHHESIPDASTLSRVLAERFDLPLAPADATALLQRLRGV